MNRNIKKLQHKAHQCEVSPVEWSDRVYQVKSPSGEQYTVTVAGTATVCDCPFGTYNTNRLCSHSLAALEHHINRQQQNYNATVSLWATHEQANRQRKRMLTTTEGLFLTLNRKRIKND